MHLEISMLKNAVKYVLTTSKRFERLNKLIMDSEASVKDSSVNAISAGQHFELF